MRLDAGFAWALTCNNLTLCHSRESHALFLPMPGEQRQRVVDALLPSCDERPLRLRTSKPKSACSWLAAPGFHLLMMQADALFRACGVRERALLLVRPDQCLGLVCKRFDWTDVETYLGTGLRIGKT